jgi:hypothetical protein
LQPSSSRQLPSQPSSSRQLPSTPDKPNPLNQKKAQNPLAAWLEQSDDKTFQRLANKYKGGDR